MLYSEEAVRANIRNRDGKRVFYLGKGDQLTSSARDWLSRERIEILPAEQARPQRYRLLSGGYVEEKPEHMTHLNGDVLVPKNHPRIVFRGKMDTLESELILCQLADKALEDIAQLMPPSACYYLCAPKGERAMKVEELQRRLHECRPDLNLKAFPQEDSVKAALEAARAAAEESDLIYIGGSTFVVAEALQD